MADEDAMRKIQALKEGIHQLGKKLAEKKHVDPYLLARKKSTFVPLHSGTGSL